MALMEACLTVLRGRDDRPDEEAVYRPAIPDLFRIPEALVRMRTLVAELSEARPLAAFVPPVPAEQTAAPLRRRSALATTFMAALELCRGGEVDLAQAEPFGPVVVHPAGVIGEAAGKATAA